MLIPIAALSLLAIAGCSDSMSPKDYSHAWREAVVKYRDINKNPGDPNATPDGGGDGSATSQRQAAEYIATQMREIATSIKDLKAPAQFQQLQDETYIFYRGQADAYTGYSQALDTGDGYKINTAVDRLNDFAGEHQKTISKIIEGLGSNGDLFRASWQGVAKDLSVK